MSLSSNNIEGFTCILGHKLRIPCTITNLRRALHPCLILASIITSLSPLNHFNTTPFYPCFASLLHFHIWIISTPLHFTHALPCTSSIKGNVCNINWVHTLLDHSLPFSTQPSSKHIHSSSHPFLHTNKPSNTHQHLVP